MADNPYDSPPAAAPSPRDPNQPSALAALARRLAFAAFGVLLVFGGFFVAGIIGAAAGFTSLLGWYFWSRTTRWL